MNMYMLKKSSAPAPTQCRGLMCATIPYPLTSPKTRTNHENPPEINVTSSMQSIWGCTGEGGAYEQICLNQPQRMPSPDSTCELMTSTQHEIAVKIDAETWMFQGARSKDLSPGPNLRRRSLYSRAGGQHPGVHAAGEGDASVAAERVGRERSPREGERDSSLASPPPASPALAAMAGCPP